MSATLRREGGWPRRYSEYVLGGLAAIALTTLMLMTVADVVGRYFLNAPIGPAFELTELLMAVVMFSALPLATIRREHITVDLLKFVTRLSFDRWQDRIIGLVCAVCLGALAWRLWLKGDQLATYGDHTLVLQLPLAPFIYGMGVLTAVGCAAQLLALFLPAPSDEKVG